jgi:hypothetical protein
MLRLAADENFNHAVLRGLRRRNPQVDAVRVQDAGLSGSDDPTVLEWAAREGRVLVTHDSGTVTRYAYDRVRAGRRMTGVIVVSLSATIGEVIEDFLLLIECTSEADWSDQVLYLPL